MAASNAALSSMLPHDKLDRFDGNNYKRWKEKIEFVLTVMKTRYVIEKECPVLTEKSTVEEKTAKQKWDEDNVLCRGTILGSLTNHLFDMYSHMKTAKEIWIALENKYKTEDSGNKSYLISNYFDFKMVDNKPILSQVHDLQLIVQQMLSEGISVEEKLQVGAIIAKLPPSWKDYRKSLKRKGDNFTLEALQRQLRIEEESRLRDNAEETTKMTKVAHVVEIDNKKGKKSRLDNPSSEKKNGNKKNIICHYCKKKGHYKNECRILKKKQQQSNKVEENLITVISEANLVVSKTDW
ncbi:uncharacterized protein [Typha angustifolia]|uniref:uncharacterized protein n=1 Tax=Typha angustifolia TaxID=59011 RepID=UPI003C2C8366